MSRVLLVAAVLAWVGMSLLLSEVRWFRRRTLSDRLARFAPVGAADVSRSSLWAVASFKDVVAPLAQSLGAAISSALGVREDLAIRLQRCHAPGDATSFRVRQCAWSAGALMGGLVAALALSAPLVVGVFLTLAAPLLAFLVIEQQLIAASKRWQQRLFAELPVVAEQLAMLLGAGYSLSAALSRVVERGNGACAKDLTRVINRVRQGLSEAEALGEWAAVADVAEVRRLVSVLALNRQGGDLGRLLADEARSMRREAHRRTIELIERRAQMVWIPVTMATLIPGVMFMAVPFIAALRDFTAL